MIEQAVGVSAAAGPLILVVDDDTAFAETLADVLETKGYHVVTACDLAHAVEATRAHHIDLALIDLKLPGANGVEVLTRIKEQSPATEAVILTAHGSVKSAVAAMGQGAFGYIEKPYDIEKLVVLTERALAHRSGSRSLDESAVRAAVPWLAFDHKTGTVSAVSPALQRLLGRFQPHDLGQLITDPAERERHLAALRATGRAIAEVPSPDGSDGWLRICSFTAGDDTEAQSVISDMTVEHQRHAEGDRLRLYFEALFTNLAAGIVIIDSEYVIHQANPAFARLCERSPDEIVGRRCHEVIHGHATPCHFHGEVCPIKNSLLTGATARVLHQHRDTRGRLRYIENTVAPLRDSSGTIVSFAAILADFTSVKQAHADSEEKTRRLEELNRQISEHQERITAQADELTRKNRELVQANATKDEFLSMVSHELRTPLTSIGEGINLVADGTLGPISDRQARFLGIALNNTYRLGDIINDLLDISRIEAGRMNCSPATCDIVRLIADAAASFGPAAHHKGIDIACPADDRPLLVFADPHLARRSLYNLLSNAVKFTDEGGIALTWTSDGHFATVTVADTGIGIPAAELNRVFERFHQSHRDGSRPPGTGLGLALTREMVRLNGGRIRLESSEGSGTTFSFTLPLDSPLARLAWLLDQRPTDKPAPHSLLLVRSRTGAGLSALLERVSSLATGNDAVAPGCFIPDLSAIALLVPGSNGQGEASARRIVAGIAADQARPEDLDLRLLKLVEETTSDVLLAEIRKELDRA